MSAWLLLRRNVCQYLYFRWTFNNSAEAKQVESRFIRTNGSRSVLTFTPTRTLEYGTLMCWSENAVGQQREPCVFHIIAAGETTFKLQKGMNERAHLSPLPDL